MYTQTFNTHIKFVWQPATWQVVLQTVLKLGCTFIPGAHTAILEVIKMDRNGNSNNSLQLQMDGSVLKHIHRYIDTLHCRMSCSSFRWRLCCWERNWPESSASCGQLSLLVDCSSADVQTHHNLPYHVTCVRIYQNLSESIINYNYTSNQNDMFQWCLQQSAKSLFSLEPDAQGLDDPVTAHAM